MRREQGIEMEDDGAGSFDDGDPYTTNLYVGNLAPDIDEEVRHRPACLRRTGQGVALAAPPRGLAMH